MARLTFCLLFLLSMFLVPLAAPAHGQFDDSGTGFDLKSEFGTLGNDILGGGQTSANPLDIESFIVPATDKQPAKLVIRAHIGTGWHIYSLTQKEGGPPKTEITLDRSDQFKLLDGFRPLEKAKVSVKPEAWPDLPLEEHYEQVTWVVPIQFSEGVDPSTVTIKGELTDGQVCHDTEGCRQFGFALHPKFAATLGAADQIASVKVPPKSAVEEQGEFDDRKNNLVIRGYVEPQVVAPGETAKLHLTVAMDPGWHIYERADEVGTGRPTLTPLISTSGLEAMAPIAKGDLIEKDGLRDHEGTTTWTIDFPISEQTAAGEYKIEGYVAYLSCSDTTCLSPSAVKFSSTVQVGEKPSAGQRAVEFVKSSYGLAKQSLDTQVAWTDGQTSGADKPVVDYDRIQQQQREECASIPLPVWLGMVLAAGFILNFMPCVLPVIGLKVMSFVQQAGEDRKQAFLLNAVYSLGILSVFWILATLAVFAGFSWGNQFQSVEFNVAMASIVFVFALSFLGVWEVPIPGFVGSGKAAAAAEKEGLSGAFFKGVLATLLATPCTGPLLGPALTWAVDQPPVLAYLAFTFVGLGMALPYMIIGAQPALLRFLPRPGAWMETFKNVMGFVLMATVVFILTYIPSEYVVPTVALMMGLWAGCWWVGRKQMTGADAGKMAVAWAGAGAFCLVIALISFMWLDDVMQARLESYVNSRITTALEATTNEGAETTPVAHERAADGHNELPWETFSQEVMEQHIATNRTVFVDFTADWCLVCKDNERKALNTKEMLEIVKENDVATLKADLTRPAPELKEMMRKLGHPSGALPYYVIFPADSPNNPILFSGAQSKASFLDKMKKAGPSQGSSDNRTAMRPTSG